MLVKSKLHLIIQSVCAFQDIPTFTQKLTQLMQDAHCAHLNETT